MRERFASSSDTDTTERRADLSHLSIGKRPRAGNLRAPRPTTTDRTTDSGSKPSFQSSSDTEIDDSNATLVQPSPLPRRKARAPSPDDTIRMDEGLPTKDVLDRLTATPTGDTPATRPKLPRR
jgi:hypothetical protein